MGDLRDGNGEIWKKEERDQTFESMREKLGRWKIVIDGNKGNGGQWTLCLQSSTLVPWLVIF